MYFITSTNQIKIFFEKYLELKQNFEIEIKFIHENPEIKEQLNQIFENKEIQSDLLYEQQYGKILNEIEYFKSFDLTNVIN